MKIRLGKMLKSEKRLPLSKRKGKGGRGLGRSEKRGSLFAIAQKPKKKKPKNLLRLGKTAVDTLDEF